MTVAASPQALASHMSAARAGFAVRPVRLTHDHPWRYAGGGLSHISGGFFSVIGLEFTTSAEAAVFLYQPQSALTGLLSSVRDGERHFLLQARAEPGAHGGVQYGPTVQSTPANYLRAHGGRATPYVEYLAAHTPCAIPYGDSVQLDLGERYFMKSKRLILADCPADLEVLPNYVWAPASVVKRCLLRSSFFNIDLRSFFAVMPWDELAGLAPSDPDVRASARSRPRPEVLGRVAAALRAPPPSARYVPLQELENWQVTSRGLFEREPRQGFGIEFYEVTAPGREVTTWVQPLVNSAGPGRAALHCRRGSGGRFEVLVRVGRERGLQTGAALLPTVLSYPGAVGRVARKDPFDPPAPSLLASTTECDEGGRFYNDISTYVLVETEAEPEDDAAIWISVAELKCLLAASNLCSIQLRGLASMLLAIE